MAAPGQADDEPEGPFDIYETTEGPRHVVNPVRRLILARMRGSELTVPEIIGATDLTKSTISTHLAVLYRQRMVAYREDPVDRRRKRYYLTARHVATSKRCAPSAEIIAGSEAFAGAGPGMVPRVLLRAFVNELACCGLDVGPVVRETGRRVGEMAGRDSAEMRAAPGDVAVWAGAAERFWTDAGLGTLRVGTPDANGELTVRVDMCKLCCAAEGPTVGLCPMAAGILEGMASQALQTNVDVHLERKEHLGEPGSEPVASGAAPVACGCSFRVHLGSPSGT